MPQGWKIGSFTPPAGTCGILGKFCCGCIRATLMILLFSGISLVNPIRPSSNHHWIIMKSHHHQNHHQNPINNHSITIKSQNHGFYHGFDHGFMAFTMVLTHETHETHGPGRSSLTVPTTAPWVASPLAPTAAPSPPAATAGAPPRSCSGSARAGAWSPWRSRCATWRWRLGYPTMVVPPIVS